MGKQLYLAHQQISSRQLNVHGTVLIFSWPMVYIFFYIYLAALQRGPLHKLFSVDDASVNLLFWCGFILDDSMMSWFRLLDCAVYIWLITMKLHICKENKTTQHFLKTMSWNKLWKNKAIWYTSRFSDDKRMELEI